MASCVEIAESWSVLESRWLVDLAVLLHRYLSFSLDSLCEEKMSRVAFHGNEVKIM
jgi:hypothetical protein